MPEENKTPITVNMGALEWTESQRPLQSILGSCVGLLIYDKSSRLAALAHIMLPESRGEKETPGKYADSAIPAMLDFFRGRRVNPANLRAKVVGGARMFALNGEAPMLDVGDRNIQTVLRQLEQHRILLEAQDLGGSKGRRVVYDPETGNLSVTVFGGASKVI